MGLPEVEDVVSGLDDLLARGVADPERIVIGGWSWGGYITLLALGRYPDRFTAGVAGAPVGDYAGSYDESAPSLQAWDRSLFGGVVTEMPEFVRERSPITYADRVRAPVLVLIAEHDTRCPPKQAHDYVDALREAGGEAELYTWPTRVTTPTSSTRRSGSGARCWSSSAGGSRFPRGLLADSKEVLPLPVLVDAEARSLVAGPAVDHQLDLLIGVPERIEIRHLQG